jgi:hypothetical protein
MVGQAGARHQGLARKVARVRRNYLAHQTERAILQSKHAPILTNYYIDGLLP